MTRWAYASMALLVAAASNACDEREGTPADAARSRAQVVNDGLPGIRRVDVGPFTFTENLSGCFGVCSTGFSDVLAGANEIVVYSTSYPDGVSLGLAGPFLEGNVYAVSISDPFIAYCAQLWQRGQPEVDFVDDSTKVFLGTFGHCWHIP